MILAPRDGGDTSPPRISTAAGHQVPPDEVLLYNTSTAIGWTQSARRHRVGRASARYVMETAGVPQVIEGGDLLWIGLDERGRELEVIAVPEDANTVVVKHVMPTALRRKPRW